MKYIQTNKFIENSVSIRSICPLEAKDMTAWNLLVFMMKQKTEDFMDKQALSMALNLAYGLKASFALHAYGDQMVLDVRFQWIAQDHLPDSMAVHEIQHCMDQLMFKAVLDEESLQEAKYMLANKLYRLQEDPDQIAIQTAFSCIEMDHTIKTKIQGSLEEVDAVTLSQVQALYARYLMMDHHVFLCGNVEPELIDYFKTMDTPILMENQRTLIETQACVYKNIQKEIYQTSLVVAYTTSIDTCSKEFYPLVLLCSLLGQSPNSLLFEEIREKQSLCYMIQSQLIRFDGLLLVLAGIEKKNVEQVSDLINQQIERVKTRQVPLEKIDIAKKDWIDALRVSQDHPFSMIERTFLDTYLHRDISLEQQIQQIKEISYDDLCLVANKLNKIVQVVVEEGNHE